MNITAQTAFCNAIARDAGYYREWLALRYGATLAYGGSPYSVSAAYRHACRLAKLLDQNYRTVVAQAIADWKMSQDDKAFAEAVVRAIDPQIKTIAKKLWAEHPNNPANKKVEKSA